MYTLVIIDMQPVFPASKNKATVSYCKGEIKKAMSKGAAIMFVEYNGYPGTLAALTSLTKKYKRTFIVTKSNDGGGKEVKDILLKNHLPKTRIKVVGVNTDFCVLETVRGLTNLLKLARIQVLAKGCNSNFNHNVGLEKLKKINRVRIIRYA